MVVKSSGDGAVFNFQVKKKKSKERDRPRREVDAPGSSRAPLAGDGSHMAAPVAFSLPEAGVFTEQAEAATVYNEHGDGGSTVYIDVEHCHCHSYSYSYSYSYS